MSTPELHRESHNSSADHTARRRARIDAQHAATRKRRWLIAAGVVLGVLALLVAIEIGLSAGRVHPGVTVSGVPVGGMTPKAASLTLQMELPKVAAKAPVRVTFGERSREVTSGELGITFDADKHVAEAMKVGRSGGPFPALGSRIRCWVKGVDVAGQAVANPDRLTVILDEIAQNTDVPAVDATVKMEGVEPVVVPGKDGRELDRFAAESVLTRAFASAAASRTVEAPVPVVPVKVDEEAAADAAEVAKRMVSGDAIVTFESKSWTFRPDDIAKWIAFRSDVTTQTGAGEGRLEAFVSPEAAARPITAALGQKIGRPAVNAKFTTSSGRVTIIPSQTGIGPDIEDLAKSLTVELTDESSDRTVELRTAKTEPEITTEKAQAMGIKERISTYTTTYSPGNKQRVNNIHLLGDALDGALIPPGGTFSFNERAGERTAAKGYQEAPAIVNGKLVPQLGGGVCQVGTTIFNAVFESGLPVVARRNHSFYIDHYPRGRDATVSWGGPDFRFKNSTEHWLLVSVSYTNSSITVSLYGTDPGYDVKAEVGEWRDIKPFRTEEIKDPTMPEGSRVVEDSGVDGKSITVKRIVSKDGKVISTDTFVSNYKPHTQVVRVGTKKPANAPVVTPATVTQP